ncbi:MAG: hypothetical protein AB7S41_02435 [Parvibaculaceae bacterium]
MPKRKPSKRELGTASALCLRIMIDHLKEAAAVAQSVEALVDKGQPGPAFQIALDVEQLIYDANQALRAASLLQRRRKM